MNWILQDSVTSTVFWFATGLLVALPCILLMLRRRASASLDLDAVRDPAFVDAALFGADRPMFLGALTSDLAGEIGRAHV